MSKARASRPARPYEAIAIELGRSLRSVYKRRADLGLATIRKRHRVAKPWRLDVVKRLGQSCANPAP